jgi:hypothetical protein
MAGRALRVALLAALLGCGTPAAAPVVCPPPIQSSPKFTGGGSVFGFLAAQWTAFFAAKADTNNGTLCNPTIIGTINLTYNQVVSALGFTPLSRLNNLLDVASRAQALANLETVAIVTATGGQTTNAAVEVWQPSANPAAATFTLPSAPVIGQRHSYVNRAPPGNAATLTVAANSGQSLLLPNGTGTIFVLPVQGTVAEFRFLGGNLWILD